jgi:hypothetical protein
MAIRKPEFVQPPIAQAPRPIRDVLKPEVPIAICSMRHLCSIENSIYEWAIVEAAAPLLETLGQKTCVVLLREGWQDPHSTREHQPN